MATYILLLRYTEQGIKGIRQAPARLDAAKEAYRRVGGELKAFYLTMGQYDAVAIAELPDEAAGAKLALSIGALGNVRTESMRAFSEQEFRRLVSELP
ncbi:MAG: GYD domain-containing protein [Gemmatimonadaceae bacterium]